eukprot:691808-Pelagomonas_calceolata.AAC.2
MAAPETSIEERLKVYFFVVLANWIAHLNPVQYPCVQTYALQRLVTVTSAMSRSPPLPGSPPSPAAQSLV